jgi:two-component sensor histidine kinase
LTRRGGKCNKKKIYGIVCLSRAGANCGPRHRITGPPPLSGQPEEIIVTVCSPYSPIVEQGILLRDLNHRINSGLASAIQLVSAAAVRAEVSEAKRALGDMVELLHGYADVQQALATPKGKALIDAATYVRMICSALRRSLLDRMNIRLALATESLPLQPERCWRLGLIVHELVTNSAKHACFDGRDGEIRIELTRLGASVNCTVSDNGSASARFKPGPGLRIVSDLAKGLDGWIEHGFDAKFRSVVLVFPLTERERRANSAVASRRRRLPRPFKAGPSMPRPPVPGRMPQITASTRSVVPVTQRI